MAALNKREQSGHVCCPIGPRRKTWNFIVVIDDLDIDVFKGQGQDLLGLSRQEYATTNGLNAYANDVLVHIEDDR